MNAIVLRRYKNGDEKQIINLRNLIFDSSRHTDQFKWQWEYVNNPLCNSKIFLYEDSGKIVGHYALIPTLLKCQDKSLLSGKSEDAMMHKHYRAYGNRFINLVKKNLDSSHNEGIDLMWGCPNKASFLPQVRAGFHYIGDVFQLIKVINIQIVLEKFIPSYIKNRYISKTFICLCSLLFSTLNIFFKTRKLKYAKNVTIRSISSFDKNIDKLWDRAKSEYGITIVRSYQYLNWRFVANPNSKNKIFIAERENEVLGYIVLGLYKSKHQIKVGCISDLFFDKKEKTALNDLLNKAIEYFEKQGVAYIQVLMVKDAGDNKSFLRPFRKRGFLFKNRKSKAPFIIETNERKVDTEFVSNIKNWYITYAFSEGVRF